MEKILIVVPELSYSGSVFSSKRICHVLVESNYSVELWSYEEGAFRKEFDDLGICPKVIDKNNLYKNKNIVKQLKSYDLVIANTIITYAIADIAKNIVPTIWYVREAQNLPWQFFASDIKRYFALVRAENIYTVSEYAKDFIQKNYNKNVQVVHNCVDDEYDSVFFDETQADNEKIKFLSLGTIEERKAFDVFLHAYMLMDSGYRDRCEMHFAGRLMNYAKRYYEPLFEEIKDVKGIIYHGEIQVREELLKLMKRADVIVVPSKDESCSLVVLEAAMMGKPVIISENVGAKYIVSEENGWIFETNNKVELKEIYQYIVDNPSILEDMGKRSREEYISTSTYESYKKRIITMVEQNLIRNKTLYKIKHIHKRGIESIQRKLEMKKDKGLLYQFPYLDIPYGSRIVLYAAGAVGQSFYNQIKKSRQYDVVLWVDKNCDVCRNNGLKVSQIDEIFNASYDYILIAVLNNEVACNIKMSLVSEGVKEEKVKWANPICIKI